MLNFIELLKHFNRKERFFLIGLALGNRNFYLSEDFRNQLNKTLSLDIPENAFCAMDYHIDWLYACLYLSSMDVPEIDTLHDNQEAYITANQEDIDFLVTYTTNNVTHLILLEAKGVTSWSNPQMKSKMNRLKKIFNNPLLPWEGKIVPYFVAVSPNEPQYLDYDQWPYWALRDGRPFWIPIHIDYELFQPTRCNSEGKQDKTGRYWKVLRKRIKTRPSR
jgi:hypothetical protein